MKAFHNLAEKIRRGEPVSKPLGAILSALTVFVRFGMWSRLRRPRIKIDARVISFGNITAGGTGKTPAVVERARAEIAAGRKVAILTRGYGSKKAKKPIAVHGSDVPANVSALLGDEPALMLRKLPEVTIVKCADRVAGAKAAIEEHGCDALILDDGFQHVMLERDENIVLVDATNPFGNGCILPRGILREPLTALSRATHIIVTRCDQVENTDDLINQLKELCPGIPIRKTRHAPCNLWRVCDGAKLPLHELAMREINAVCAIGNPESFFTTLENAGAIIKERHAFPDHQEIPQKVLTSADTIVTTEKDAAKMAAAGENVLALGIEMQDI